MTCCEIHLYCIWQMHLFSINERAFHLRPSFILGKKLHSFKSFTWRLNDLKGDLMTQLPPVFHSYTSKVKAPTSISLSKELTSAAPCRLSEQSTKRQLSFQTTSRRLQNRRRRRRQLDDLGKLLDLDLAKPLYLQLKQFYNYQISVDGCGGLVLSWLKSCSYHFFFHENLQFFGAIPRALK